MRRCDVVTAEQSRLLQGSVKPFTAAHLFITLNPLSSAAPAPSPLLLWTEALVQEQLGLQADSVWRLLAPERPLLWW